MEGGRVKNSLCMGVVSHIYGGFAGEGWKWWLFSMLRNPKGVDPMSKDAGALPECYLKIQMTRDPIAFGSTALGRVESELVGLPGKALIWDAKRRLWIIVHAAD